MPELNLMDTNNSRKEANLSKTSIDDIFGSVLKNPGSRITISINAPKTGAQRDTNGMMQTTDMAEPLPDATKDVLNDLTGGGMNSQGGLGLLNLIAAIAAMTAGGRGMMGRDLLNPGAGQTPPLDFLLSLAQGGQQPMGAGQGLLGPLTGASAPAPAPAPAPSPAQLPPELLAMLAGGGAGGAPLGGAPTPPLGGGPTPPLPEGAAPPALPEGLPTGGLSPEVPTGTPTGPEDIQALIAALGGLK